MNLQVAKLELAEKQDAAMRFSHQTKEDNVYLYEYRKGSFCQILIPIDIEQFVGAPYEDIPVGLNLVFMGHYR